jgi:hypothetical protein
VKMERVEQDFFQVVSHTSVGLTLNVCISVSKADGYVAIAVPYSCICRAHICFIVTFLYSKFLLNFCHVFVELQIMILLRI